MRLLGIRVEPKKTSFVVLEADDNVTILNSELILIPSALDLPDQLSYMRNCVLDILREYEVQKAGIRLAETTARKINITRLNFEGVIQEAFSSSDLESYFTGRKVSIKSRLKIDMKDIQNIIDGKSNFELITNWNELDTDYSREAALVALAAKGA